ncbi:methionine aminotransferase [Flavihumibacter profundi]|uniref:methionine aminotransferase n=1 Tax=Flavihumibacter profundi TaxID=2716883 RepID=UPI001CC493E7|nr:methionine aminotransferase [Flavihumibacter profundi]MBZ5859074.1 aminotransferase class I/II-fold pyridoxal phosphate-dependent enzyme [Flavihumibacter profundi]
MTSIPFKLPRVGTTIFTTMSALATELNAVNLGQGFPDFPMDKRLSDAVARAMDNQFNQYAPMAGWLPLREILAEKIGSLYKSTVNPDTEITITPGGTYAIYTALTTILLPGDEVIVLEPAYDSYVPNIEVNGGKAVLVPMNLEDLSINWPAVRAAVTPKTKAIIINSPHNPTGAILGEHDIRELRSIVEQHDLFIISDEVYEHLIYDGKEHQSMLRYPDLLARSFVCFSFGKVFHCTGWKLGYCVAPAALMKEFRKIHQFNCFSCHTPSQVGIAEFLQDRESYLSLNAFLQQKRDYFITLMQQTRFTLKPSYGSYFICAGYEAISSEPDIDFALRVTREFGVATIPVSAFYQYGTTGKLIRFCFAKKQETLEKAVQQLTRL